MRRHACLGLEKINGQDHIFRCSGQGHDSVFSATVPVWSDEDNQDSSLQKVYQRNELQAQLEAHKASSSVFGDLQYKLALLKTNNTEKQVQLVFTHHTKKRRQGRVDTVTTDFAQEKIPSITRQCKFVKYCVSVRTIKRHHQLQRKHGNY